MLQRLPSSGRGTTDQTVSAAGQAVSEDFFAEMAKAMFPKDAGLFLHCLTGFEERSCYRYAAGDRKVPGHFLATLLRTHQGAQFLAFIMEGSDARWWRDYQRALRIAQQIDKLDLE